LAVAGKIDQGYLGRLLQLSSLASGIVEAALDDQHPEEMTLAALQEGMPVEWQWQRAALRAG